MLKKLEPPKGYAPLVSLLLWSIALFPFLVLPFFPRSFDVTSYESALVEGFGFARLWARGVNLLLFSWLLLLFLRALFKSSLRWYFLMPLFFLWLGAGASMVFSIEPRLSPGHIIYLLALSIVTLVTTKDDLDSLILTAKRISLLYIWGSLLVLLVMPSWALEVEYARGYIPGFNIRLHGITVHANHTAPFAWLFLVLEIVYPRQGKKAMRAAHILAAIVVLVLTQSKTTWLLMLLGLLLFIFLKSPKVLWFFLSVAAVSLGSIFLGQLLTGGGVSAWSWLKERLFLEVPEEIFTLTGRVFIWETVMLIVRENPLFGYGPNLWSPEMTLRYASWVGWTPAQSHNQYIQSLGEGGIFGLSMFFGYITWVLFMSIRSLKVARGLSFILFSGWLIRGFTETWFRKETMDGNMLIHAIILAIVLASFDMSRILKRLNMTKK